MTAERRIADFYEWAKEIGVETRNLECRVGQHGVEMRAQDPELPIMLWVPEELLLDHSKVDFTSGVLHASVEAGPNHRAFYEEYLKIVLDPQKMDWKHELSEAFRAEADIPERVHAIKGLFSEIGSAEQARRELAHARTLGYRRDTGIGPVFMPIMDFLNHDEKGLAYQRVLNDRGGLKVEGHAVEGEVFAFYGHKDPLALLSTYGFHTNCQSRFSLRFELTLVDGRTLGISRQLNAFNRVEGCGLVPSYRVDGDRVELENLCLASTHPLIFPKAAWSYLSKKLNLPRPEVIWGTILRQNYVLLWWLNQRALQIKHDRLREMVASAAQSQFLGLVR